MPFRSTSTKMSGKTKLPIADRVRNLCHAITLEPMIFLFVFNNFIGNGAQQNNNILLHKICRDHLGHNKSVCSNPNLHPDIQTSVLKAANLFSLNLELVGIVPTIFYTLIGGALSDEYGKRKPLILLPLFGGLLTSISYILISTFFDTIPLWAFFMTKSWELCGGMPLYYLGVCGYAATISKESKRSTSLARFDGVEQTSLILGVSLSPLIFRTTGFFGCFLIRAIGNLLAILYLIFLTPEVSKRKVSDTQIPFLNHGDIEDNIQSLEKPPLVKVAIKVKNTIFRYIVQPLRASIEVFKQPRDSKRTIFLWVQIFNYTLYWFAMEEQNLLYFYMKEAFTDFDGSDFALYVVVTKVAGIIGLLLAIPLMSQYFKLHDTVILVIITTTTTAGILSSAFVSQLYPYFYITRLVGFLRPSTLAIARSLITQTVDGPEEICRILAITGLLSSIMPFISNPSFRMLFDASVATSWPNAILMLASGLFAIASCTNVYLFLAKPDAVTASK